LRCFPLFRRIMLRGSREKLNTMDEIEVTPATIAAGVEALVLVGDTSAEMLVEIIYRAMVKAAASELTYGASRLLN